MLETDFSVNKIQSWPIMTLSVSDILKWKCYFINEQTFKICSTTTSCYAVKV